MSSNSFDENLFASATFSKRVQFILTVDMPEILFLLGAFSSQLGRRAKDGYYKMSVLF